MMVLARKGDDFSFTQTGWAQGIAPEDFNFRRNWSGSAARYHTVLDRALFRAGETVSMKHFFRRHSMNGLEVESSMAGVRDLVIRHDGSGQEYPCARPSVPMASARTPGRFLPKRGSATTRCR